MQANNRVLAPDDQELRSAPNASESVCRAQAVYMRCIPMSHCAVACARSIVVLHPTFYHLQLSFTRAPLHHLFVLRKILCFAWSALVGAYIRISTCWVRLLTNPLCYGLIS